MWFVLGETTDSRNITGAIKGIVKVHLEASEWNHKDMISPLQVYIHTEFSPQACRVQKQAQQGYAVLVRGEARRI